MKFKVQASAEATRCIVELGMCGIILVSASVRLPRTASATAISQNDFQSVAWSRTGFVTNADHNAQVDGPDGVRFYDQPEYGVFWSTIAKLDTVVYIHPR